MLLIDATEKDKTYFKQLNCLCYRDMVIKQFGSWQDHAQDQKFDIKWQEQSFKTIRQEDGEEIIGGIWVEEFETHWQLRELQIHPDFQNKGLGTQVLVAELNRAASAEREMRLRVLFQNPAYGLYLRLGFIVAGKNTSQYLMTHAIRPAS